MAGCWWYCIVALVCLPLGGMKNSIFFLIFGLYFSIVGGLILIVYTRKNKALFFGLAPKALGNKFTLVVGWIVYSCITVAYILFIFNQ